MSYSIEKTNTSILVKFPFPKNITEGDKFLFQNTLTSILQKPKTVTIHNASVTQEGIVYKGLKCFKQFLVWKNHKKTYNFSYLLRSIFKKKINLDTNKKYILCFDYWTHGYFHWMCDFLPRLYTIQEQLQSSIVLIPSSYTSDFFNATLKAFNVKNSYRIPSNHTAQCNHLIIPERVSNSGEHHPEIIANIRKKLLEFYKNELKKTVYADKIYVSRNKSKYRKVINEADVIHLLSNHGFQTIYFEDYTFSEQIAIAHHAKNMVSLHGANMTNLMFMQPNTNVLEFRKNDIDHVNCYFSLANSLDINYYYQNCNYVINNQTGGNAFDVTVDIKKLEENILLMLKN